LYKETLAENAAYYRVIQLKELENLGRAFAINNSTNNFADKNKIAKLLTTF
jgi:hypothetical protein